MAQSKKHSFEVLDSLSRDSIVTLAESYIREKDFSRENFDLVLVRKINKGDQKKYSVTFKPSVMFLSMRHLHYSTVTVDLLSGSISHAIESRGRRFKWEAPYYKKTGRAKRVIRFISKAARRNGEVTPPDKVGKTMTVVIHERLLYYQVDVNSSSTYGFYRVNKITGSVYRKGHKHKMELPDDEEDY